MDKSKRRDYRAWKDSELAGLVRSSVRLPVGLNPYTGSEWKLFSPPGTKPDPEDVSFGVWRVLHHDHHGVIYHCAYHNWEVIYASREAVDAFVMTQWEMDLETMGEVRAARNVLTRVALQPDEAGSDVAKRLFDLVGFETLVAMAGRTRWMLRFGEREVVVAAACGIPYTVLTVWTPAIGLSQSQLRQLHAGPPVASAYAPAAILFDGESGSLYARTYGGAYYLLSDQQQQTLLGMVG